MRLSSGFCGAGIDPTNQACVDGMEARLLLITKFPTTKRNENKKVRDTVEKKLHIKTPSGSTPHPGVRQV